MNTVDITDQDIRLGKKTLKQVLKEARRQPPLRPSLEKAHPEDHPEPSIMDPYICISNLKSLVLREQDGLWFAEFVLKKVPAGWPDVFGTPTDEPHSTREAAYRDGYETAKLLFDEEAAGRWHTRPYPGEPLILGGV